MNNHCPTPTIGLALISITTLDGTNVNPVYWNSAMAHYGGADFKIVGPIKPKDGQDNEFTIQAKTEWDAKYDYEDRTGIFTYALGVSAFENYFGLPCDGTEPCY